VRTQNHPDVNVVPSLTALLLTPLKSDSLSHHLSISGEAANQTPRILTVSAAPATVVPPAVPLNLRITLQSADAPAAELAEPPRTKSLDNIADAADCACAEPASQTTTGRLYSDPALLAGSNIANGCL
jgi:hypothetical protein